MNNGHRRAIFAINGKARIPARFAIDWIKLDSAGHFSHGNASVMSNWFGGEIVMLLWNWLLPPLFGWRTITFWQALGVLALCRILFGDWGCSGGGKGHMRHRMRERMAERMGERMRERWEKMTPEEGEKFRQGLRGCWDAMRPADSKISG